MRVHGRGRSKIVTEITFDFKNVTICSVLIIIPVVTGVTDGKTFTTARTVTFDDGTGSCTATIASIITTGTGSGTYSTAASFTNGSTISADGKYKLIVTGSTGLITTVEFCVYPNAYLKGNTVANTYAGNTGSTTYIDNFIARISISSTQTLTITKADGSAIANPSTTKVATTMLVKVTVTATGDIVSTQTAVVYGDTNVDGLINSGDALAVKKQIFNATLTGAKLEAANADRDVNGTVNSADVLKIKRFALNVGTVYQY